MAWKVRAGIGIVLGFLFLLLVGMFAPVGAESNERPDRVIPSPTAYPDPSRGGVGTARP